MCILILVLAFKLCIVVLVRGLRTAVVSEQLLCCGIRMFELLLIRRVCRGLRGPCVCQLLGRADCIDKVTLLLRLRNFVGSTSGLASVANATEGGDDQLRRIEGCARRSPTN